MLLPANIPLQGVIGFTFDASIQLFSDDAKTIPFDLSPYDTALAEFEVDGLTTLTVGAGLTVDAGSGTFTAKMPLTQTAPVSVGSSRYRIKLPRVDGTDADTPVYGSISWIVP